MTSQRHWARQGLILPVAVLCVIALLVFIGLTIITNARTSSLAKCLNNNLAARMAVTKADYGANLAIVTENGIWTKDLVAIFGVKSGTPEAIAAYATIVDETTALANVYAVSLATLKADQSYRDQHPLGKC